MSQAVWLPWYPAVISIIMITFPGKNNLEEGLAQLRVLGPSPSLQGSQGRHLKQLMGTLTRKSFLETFFPRDYRLGQVDNQS